MRWTCKPVQQVTCCGSYMPRENSIVPITAASTSIEWVQALRFPMLPCRRLQHNYLKKM